MHASALLLAAGNLTPLGFASLATGAGRSNVSFVHERPKPREHPASISFTLPAGVEVGQDPWLEAAVEVL